LLDFDSFALADPVLDAAHALAQILGIGLRFSVPHERLSRAAQAFKQEYFAHVPGNWQAGFRSHYGAAILKVAVGFFRRQEGAWSNKVAILINQAREPFANL